MAGPALGSLAALSGPRLPFFLAAGIAAVNTVVGGSARYPETPGRDGRRAAPCRWPGTGHVAPDAGVAFCSLVAFSGFEATFALFGQRHLGFGIASSAAVFTAVGAAIVVVQGGVAHRVVRRLGEVRTLLAGLLANAGGLACSPRPGPGRPRRRPWSP